MADISQDPAANHVLQALNTLYTNTDRQTQEQANAWLEEFQKKVCPGVIVFDSFLIASARSMDDGQPYPTIKRPTLRT